MSHYKNALDYVAEHLLEHVLPSQIEYALDVSERFRCPIDKNITDAVYDLMEEYGKDNDLPSNWWTDKDDEEEIFFKVYDSLNL